MARSRLSLAPGDHLDQSVERYLATLAAALHAPPLLARPILDELRTGLLDAVEAHRSVGLDQAAAVAAAIEEFGPPDCVADAFAPLVAATRARRRMITLARSGPAVGAAWIAALALAPTLAWRAVPGLLWPVVGLLAIAITTVLGSALLTFAATGRATRWFAPPARLFPTTATTAGVATCAADLVLLVGAALLSATTPGALHLPLAAVAAAASMVRAVTVAAVTARSR